MCGEAFWKRVTVFCLTFGLGFFISNAFVSPETVPVNINMVLSAPSISKNCFPVDGNLAYQNLPFTEEEPTLKVPLKEKSKLEPEKQTEKKTLAGEKSTTKVPEVPPPSNDSLKESAKYQTLLHKEKCYESDERK